MLRVSDPIRLHVLISAAISQGADMEQYEEYQDDGDKALLLDETMEDLRAALRYAERLASVNASGAD